MRGKETRHTAVWRPRTITHCLQAAENHHSLPGAAMKRQSGVVAAKNHHSLPPRS